jgi:tRNA nucleotidyltransferase (CCA-adding enzyme)
MEIFEVGGAVRDRLLGLPVKERDWVVVGATADQMLALGYRQVGRDFPVFLHPDSKEEYALARTERKSGKGHTGFAVHAAPDVTLEQDLQRRDLTINAIARDAQGNLVDPCQGQADLDARILRHVSPAFAEDPLRVLRVARFAARFAGFGFRVAPETMTLMQQIVASGELAHLAAERIWQELHKALLCDQPQTFFWVLRDCGALALLLPELERLFGIPQPVKAHPEVDTGIHAMLVLHQAAVLSLDPVVRFAALVHDLGKGLTAASDWPDHKGHEAQGAVLVEQLCERLRVPNEYRELGKLASLYHGRCHQALQHAPEDLLHTLELTDAFRRPQRFQSLLLVCEADSRGREGKTEKPYPQAQRLSLALAAARGIDQAALARQHSQTAELLAAIRKQRINAIMLALEQK